MFDWVVYLPISGTEVNGFALILLGFTVGVIGGFFGVGGAFMVTPALNVFGFPMAYAIGTDMAHIAGKSIVSTFKHRKFGNVDMKLAVWMIVGTVIGIELGATLIMWLERLGRIGPIVRVTYMVLLFGLGSFMLYEYLRGVHTAKRQPESTGDARTARLAQWFQSIRLRPMVHLKVSGFEISIWVIIGMGVLTGFLAGFLGVGGGFIRMPALMYIIGAPTKVAVGTDLFEVMVTGAYGAFSYAMKGRVELLAACIMLLGAALGAQLGATATHYARGTIIRLYFAITMMAGGLSVVFKHLAERHKDVYRAAQNDWARSVSGLTDKVDLGIWVQTNKPLVQAWFAQQPQAMRDALAAERMWSSYSGILMLGASCTLSVIIIFWLLRGILREREQARKVAAAPATAAAPQARPERESAGVVIAGDGDAAHDRAALRVGAALAQGLAVPARWLWATSAPTPQAAASQLAEAGLTDAVVLTEGRSEAEVLTQATGARLLVVAAPALSPRDPRWHVGDAATRLVRHMTTSTLVVRGRDRVQRILLSTDLPVHAGTLNLAADVALASGAALTVLYTEPLATMHPPQAAGAGPLDIAQEAERLGVSAQALAELQGAVDALRARGIANVALRLRTGIVEEEILRESVAGDFDLIVLREGYLSTPLGLLLGRLSTNVATHTPQASVLVVQRHAT